MSGACAWTEAVEDLLHVGDVDGAISLLESTISNLERETVPVKNDEQVVSSSSKDDELARALEDLSKLYSTKGFSLKADRALSRSLQIKILNRGLAPKEPISDVSREACVSKNEATTSAGDGRDGNSSNLQHDGFPEENTADDDWEAVADRAPEELLSPQSLPGVSKLSLEDSKPQTTKRRGRGPFSYRKQGLHCDNQSDEPVSDDSDNNSMSPAESHEKHNLMYGTNHVLLLADFPPSTRTTDLEKLLEKFKNCFVIRWVNDTTALAVFRTSSIALEARNSIQCPFKVHILEETDELLSSIPPKDLEPPRQRPQTSARTAQRLIAQGMGIKLPSSFGATELRKQEEARRNRIVSRQNLRDDAWGGDE